MRTWRKFGNGALAATSALVLLLAVSTGTAGAYYLFKRFVPLHDVRNTGASGEALIDYYGSQMPGERVVGINTYGLKPSSVYTVWLTNPATPYGNAIRRALGIDSNYFRTDGAGNGRYVTTANEDDLQGWRFLDIDYNPDGNPKNTKDMITILRGDMVYGYHY